MVPRVADVALDDGLVLTRHSVTNAVNCLRVRAVLSADLALHIRNLAVGGPS